MGRYDVKEGEGGMYGLVFDNTFSKQVSKTATFVLMTHPTSAPPKSGAQLHYSQAIAAGSTTSLAKPSPHAKPAQDSTESLPQYTSLPETVSAGPIPKIKHDDNFLRPNGAGNFHNGVLYKKRRKRAQGYARRFFSLDFTSSTLSYYRNSHSSALRGAIPLALAAVGVNEKNREFSVDSGAEVWHLKAGNKKDFDTWRIALERASSTTISTPGPGTPLRDLNSFTPTLQPNPAEEREWARVEEIVSRVSGSRDAMRRLAQDTDPKYSGAANGLGISDGGSPAGSIESAANPFFLDAENASSEQKFPFWKRKPSAAGTSPSRLFGRSVSAQVPSSPSPAPSRSPNPQGINMPKQRVQAETKPTEGIHDRCMALLRDLDAAVSDFSALLAESKSRRAAPLLTSTSRLSIDSTTSDEFFDAEDGARSPSQLFTIRRSSEFSSSVKDVDEKGSDVLSDDDNSSEASSDSEDAATVAPHSPAVGTQSSLFPPRPRTLSPLPLPNTSRRTTVPPPKQPPPSIIGFLRKNAGKDLSTVSMPVSANEPLSALQRLSEPLEASALIDAAARLTSPDQAADRLMYVAAFAVAAFASNRVKERAIRKPFNPMLGETFELVREDLGWRFIAEKVEHHPLRMAFQADGGATSSSPEPAWSLTQSPSPSQKFWGKSVELNTEGLARLILHNVSNTTEKSAQGERYTYASPTAFLRNVIAGEKYVEPVQSITILCETSGYKAIATFKAAGMFAGRSEDVSVALYAPGGSAPLPLSLQGKWTQGLTRSDTGETVWTPGPLVENAAKVYGFPTFAAALNEVTDVEAEKLPCTDSRLRPDQRALEEGALDRAEGLKARLEERQRSRRKVLEAHGRKWEPRFFEKVGEGEEEVWRRVEGKSGYWERREVGLWNGIEEVFET